MDILTYDKCKILIPFGHDPLKLSLRKYQSVRVFAEEITKHGYQLHEALKPFVMRIDDRKQIFDFMAFDNGLAPNYLLQCFSVTKMNCYVRQCDLITAQEIKPEFQSFELWEELNPQAKDLVEENSRTEHRFNRR